MKGEIGRQYTTNTTFKDVLQRLRAAFENLESRSGQGCVNKANQNLALLLNHILTIELEDNGDAKPGASDEESSEHYSSSSSESSVDSLQIGFLIKFNL